MSITTEEAEGWALACDFCSLPSVATALRSIAAERDDLAKRLKDAERERNHQHIRADRNAAQWAEEQAKREQLRDAINAALTEKTPMEGGLWSQEPIGPNETPAEAIKRLIKFRVDTGCIVERDALKAEIKKLRARAVKWAGIVGTLIAERDQLIGALQIAVEKSGDMETPPAWVNGACSLLNRGFLKVDRAALGEKE
jgi:hypothetical protein